MKNLKSTFAVLCLSAVFGSAHANEFAGAASINEISFSASNYGVYVTGQYATYYNLVGTYISGSGYINSFAHGTYGQYSIALNEAFTGPGAGFAQSGYGYEQFITLTNYNAGYQGVYITVSSQLIEYNETTAHGYSTAFGGLLEEGGHGFYSFNTVNENNGQIDSVYTAPGWTLISDYFNTTYSESTVQSYGGFTDYLAWGQSITIGAWSSGIVSVNTSGAVPGPAAVAPFAIGVVAALRRRNKR